MPFPNRPRQGLRNRNNPQNRKNWQSRRRLPHLVRSQIDGDCHAWNKTAKIGRVGIAKFLASVTLTGGLFTCHHRWNR